MFRAMRGQGQQGLEQWIEDASPYLDAWKREGTSWLGLPAFGFAREQQERWQALAQAQLEYQERTNAYNALMFKAAQRAYEVFESKLAERSEPGRQLQSARALFDLWIDAAEEAYAEIALSPEFRKVYGALVNAQMRVRAGVQKEVEQASGMFGMPTRTEVDAAHRKIAQLERELRRLRDAVAATQRDNAPAQPARQPGASLKIAGDPLTGPRKRPAAKATKPAKPATKKSTKGKR
jgi:class III poly(R)-hydroxyalkanoic acid synthase PhaE subunit